MDIHEVSGHSVLVGPPWAVAYMLANDRAVGDTFLIQRHGRSTMTLFRWDVTEWIVTEDPPAIMYACGFGFTRRGAMRSLRRHRRSLERP